MRHAQRLKNIFFSKLAQRFSAYSLNDESEQKISGIAVDILFPRLVIELFLPRNQTEVVIVCQVNIASPHASQCGQGIVVADAAGVMNEVLDGDRTLIAGNLRKILLNPIIQGKFPLPCQKQNAHCCKLLGDGGNREDGFSVKRNVIVQISHAVAAFVN